ncbi:MAG: hypothetical protein AMXMBFR60_26440 [Chloroflexota bacterium]
MVEDPRIFFDHPTARLTDYPTTELPNYNHPMTDYKFLHPTEVRYGDLDPQGHVNNAKYLTYFEQARIHHFIKMGLFSKDQSFMEIGVIVADIHIKYRAPAHYGDNLITGAKISRIGNKSLIVTQSVMDAATGKAMADGEVILVTFDYKSKKTIPVPEDWKRKIAEFEGI